jgi:hypothetical protein
MNRRPWMVAALVGVAMAAVGCAGDRGPQPEQLAEELSEVKADRDRLATLVRQLTTSGATLEAYTVNNRQGCLRTLRNVRQRLARTHAGLHAGEIDGSDASTQLGQAIRRLDDAATRDCAPAVP